MRILVLSKRQYTNRDLIDDRFGRLRELPLALASAGNKVTGVCLSYWPRPEGLVEDKDENSQLSGTPERPAIAAIGIKKLAGEPSKKSEEAFAPIWSGLFGRIARDPWRIRRQKINAAMVIDLYDNFESFPATRFPGVTTQTRRVSATLTASHASAASAHYVRKTAFTKGR